MRIFVSLFGAFRDYGPQSRRSFELDLKQGASVKDAAESLLIPEKEARVSIVNGRPASNETTLNPDDKLVFLSPLEGG